MQSACVQERCLKAIRFWTTLLLTGQPTSLLPARLGLLSRPENLQERSQAHFGIQESGVAGVQELENLGAWRGFSEGDAGPGFWDKDLARVFCNSCNSCNSC